MLGPRGAVSLIMDPHGESTPDEPCSLGSMPPQRHHRRAGVGWYTRHDDDCGIQPLEAGPRFGSRRSWMLLLFSVNLWIYPLVDPVNANHVSCVWSVGIYPAFLATRRAKPVPAWLLLLHVWFCFWFRRLASRWTVRATCHGSFLSQGVGQGKG